MKRVLVFAFAGVAAWLYFSQPAAPDVRPAPRLVTPQPGSENGPRRQLYAPGAAARVQTNGYELRPLKAFALKARALSVTHSRTGREADLSPTDIAFGWGRMADPTVSGQLSISQSSRWYYWRYSGTPPLPPPEIARSSANMHLIPADAEVARRLRAVDEGQLVALRGYLVEARAQDGWSWRSSLSREDTGDGSCELVFVQSIEIH